MERLEKIEYIRAQVESYITSNYSRLSYEMNKPTELEHIKSVAVSIIADEHDIMRGGGFVQAFNDNDLQMTFGRADNIIREAIPFLIMLKQNININKLSI